MQQVLEKQAVWLRSMHEGEGPGGMGAAAALSVLTCEMGRAHTDTAMIMAAPKRAYVLTVADGILLMSVTRYGRTTIRDLAQIFQVARMRLITYCTRVYSGYYSFTYEVRTAYSLTGVRSYKWSTGTRTIADFRDCPRGAHRDSALPSIRAGV